MRSVLVTGASGLLGRQVHKVFQLDGWNAVGTALSRPNPPSIIKVDITNAEEFERALDEVKPQAVVHCAANRFPDSCTANPEAAKKLNVDASRAIASATTSRGILLIYISTDYVFSGQPGQAPYTPNSATDPPNIYGQTKLDGEKAVLDVRRTAPSTKNKVVILRLPILYGSCDEPSQSAVNILMSQLWNAQMIKPGEPKIKVDDHALRYPTNTEDVGRVCRDICKLYLDTANTAHDLPDILQFSSEDRMTKWQICQAFSDIMGLPLDGMEPFKPEEEPKDGVKRPYDCHLDTSELKDLGIDVSTVDFRTWWRREVRAFRH
ncbi:NAD(P)-binding protein [Lindgomyces ingoldianus]|uniref:NAD(P)-binding protein n=1 Tax=Lindgomyces ingoldianus TaxID=673940 RepID=A0ACB6Q7H1_9PLEO|nr:NAD(P)-binding protein [Lindgomyces ingoldianus]KAF2462750.1 NAD(P)-binding protein [Lindgomyces ingoldianus]